MEIEKYKGMLIVRNRVIPAKGFKCMNLFGILFAKPKAILNDVTLNHEAIHSRQQKEMLFVFFYVWYLVEWIIKCFVYGWEAYENLGFEREAYENEKDMEYLDGRKLWNWTKYL